MHNLINSGQINGWYSYLVYHQKMIKPLKILPNLKLKYSSLSSIESKFNLPDDSPENYNISTSDSPNGTSVTFNTFLFVFLYLTLICLPLIVF